MNVTFGEHKGTSVETLILKEPGYVSWVLSVPNPSGPMRALKAEIERLITIFDGKPFSKVCHGCQKVATNCSVYRYNTYMPMWWCDNCDPYQSGADAGKLQVISTYRQALGHSKAYSTTKDALRTLIKTMAQAKGLPARIGKSQAQAFFS